MKSECPLHRGPIQDGSGELPGGVLGHRTVVVDLVTAAHSRGHSRSHSRGTAVRQGELEEGRNLSALRPGLRRRMKARVPEWPVSPPLSFFSGKEPG